MVSRIASLACYSGLAASAATSTDRRMSFVPFASSGSREIDAAQGILCGDGTISGIFFLAASEAKDADKWLMWFQGGGGGTSSNWGKQAYPIDFQFGDEFATWNQVYFKTCCADFRSGQRKTPATDGTYKQGHLHVVNGIAEMKKRVTTKMTKLLIGGCSGGGHSQVINVDYIASQMPAGVDVRASINSGLYFDIASYPDFVAGKMDERPHISKENAQELNAFVDESCRTALGDDWYKCIAFDHAFPYISTPSFVSQAKYDLHQLQQSLGVPSGSFKADTSTWSKAVNDYTAYYGERSTKVFVEAINKGNNHSALFLPSCFDHCYATTCSAPETVTTDTGHSYTAKEAFQSWYHNTNTERFYLDACADKLPCNRAADPRMRFSCASTPTPSPTPTPTPSGDCYAALVRACENVAHDRKTCLSCAQAHQDELEWAGCTDDQVKALCPKKSAVLV